ncbi:hypothetical protein [Insolitispirillum peregrinum]|uniref:Uncharacterized protein n=1 Tax=Insolitispirillum peregrinum TaxID=80876 RepID=A0A1N7JAC5_9PROT|nr:hypothetical protein [Insolitispirillum peregrinum]SIS46206.1 hypothetical protein SAMN05421779_10223 [Insolitispirillum peregrinum]
MNRPAPAHYPPEQDLPTLLPLGGVAVRVGALGSEWKTALAKAVGPKGQVLVLSGGETPADCLDLLVERSDIQAIHLVVVGPLLSSLRVLRLARRAMATFGPVIALLGGPQQRDAISETMLAELHYEMRSLPDGLTVLLPKDD